MARANNGSLVVFFSHFAYHTWESCFVINVEALLVRPHSARGEGHLQRAGSYGRRSSRHYRAKQQERGQRTCVCHVNGQWCKLSTSFAHYQCRRAYYWLQQIMIQIKRMRRRGASEWTSDPFLKCVICSDEKFSSSVHFLSQSGASVRVYAHIICGLWQLRQCFWSFYSRQLVLTHSFSSCDKKPAGWSLS